MVVVAVAVGVVVVAVAVGVVVVAVAVGVVVVAVAVGVVVVAVAVGVVVVAVAVIVGSSVGSSVGFSVGVVVVAVGVADSVAVGDGEGEAVAVAVGEAVAVGVNEGSKVINGGKTTPELSDGVRKLSSQSIGVRISFEMGGTITESFWEIFSGLSAEFISASTDQRGERRVPICPQTIINKIAIGKMRIMICQSRFFFWGLCAYVSFMVYLLFQRAKKYKKRFPGNSFHHGRYSLPRSCRHALRQFRARSLSPCPARRL